MALDKIGCMFLDGEENEGVGRGAMHGDEENGGVGRGAMHGDSSLLVSVMSEPSITESNKLAEKFGRPQLGHFQEH